MKNNLLRELEDLKIQLEEQGGATANQVDMNRKREAELAQLRVEMTTQAEENEKTVADLRKKQANAVGELEEQVAALQKTKGKLEKDVHRVNAELMDASGQLEDSDKAKVSKRSDIKCLREKKCFHLVCVCVHVCACVCIL